MADINIRVGSHADTGGLDKTAAAARATSADFDKLAGKIGKEVQESMGGLVKNLAAAVISFGALKGAVTSSIQAFEEQERADKMLAQVAGEFTEALKAQAAAFQQTLGVSDDMVQGLQTMALRFGAAPKQIHGLTEAVLDWAAATGKDAPEAMRTLMVGVENGGAGLKKLGVHYESTGSKGKDLDLVVEQLQKRFGGSAATAADTLQGSMLRLKAETGELKEAFGGFIAKVAEDTGIVRLMTEALVEWRMIAAQGHDADNTAQGKRSEEYQAITKEVGNTAEVLKGLKKDLDTAEKTGILPDGFFRIEELRKAVADMSAILTDAKKRRAEMLGLHLEAGEAEAGIVTKGETSKDPTGKVKTAKEIADEVERIKKDSLDRQIRMGNAFEDEKKKQRDEEWMAVDAERDQMKEWEKEMAMGADFAKAAQKEKVREIEESAKTLDEVLERGAEEAKRAKRYYEQAGTSIGYSFASALSSTIETAISGGDTGMAIADGILSIAGSFTDFLPFPLNVLIKSALGIGKAVVHAGAKRMDQDGGRTKGPGYRHNGGWVDDSGPYFHDGGWPGLRPDEVPIIAQKGERVLNRQESLEYTRGSGGGRGSITMNINAVDAKSVRELLTGEGGRGFYNAVRTGRGMLPQLIRGT